ncbi:MAG: hypothetical protein JOZ32_15585 [Bryobacterales bacterium]|nr:hypothetical protein [Bryobacterales bacterium]
MPLLIPRPPLEYAATFSAGLSTFLATTGGPADTFIKQGYVGTAPPIPTLADVTMGEGPNPDALKSSIAIQVFTVSLYDAANNTGALSPKSSGWRFFAGDEQGKTVLGRVTKSGPNQAWKLAAVHYGDLVWETRNAVLSLEKSPPQELQGKDYELRIMAIPGLNLEVFWMHAKGPGSVDFIFPAPSAATERTAGRPYSSGAAAAYPGSALGTLPMDMQSFLAEIRPLAASLLAIGPTHGA